MARVSGAARGAAGLGKSALRGAANFVERTKENLQERHEEKKKEKASKPGRPLTAAEAEELHDTYHQALAGLFEMSDQVIHWTAGGKDTREAVEIWSTIDDDDIDIIVEVRLQDARTSARAAAGVRRTIAAYRKIKIGGIVLPRAFQTIALYSEEGIDIPLHLPKKRRKLRTVESRPA